MKMFKVCRTCIDNLHTINYPSSKLCTKSNKMEKCPMNPTCSGQPERSKREDLDCCKRLEEISYIANRYENYTVKDINYDIVRIHQYLIREAKMRCSEHCGNTVRDK